MSSLLPRRRERAFERFYRRHVADVYRYALLVLRDSDAADSATQATFVRALRAHARGERPRGALNWLLGIAHDVCEQRSPGASLERAVLMLREVEYRSYAEIADVLERDDRKVESLVFRARKALSEQFDGSLTCHQAERAISRRLDEHLPREERKRLRAHLRSCPDCVRFELLHRESRAALRSFRRVPLPDSLRVSLARLTGS
ncbi:MAG TPA: sigma factor-like helix-turn-helix DNA-binding protein [Gaiellaceae bacterium]|nr:sigma factor-like helix-turn-helix DNA-binding protein [Gaiellaceae bacterium]